MHRLRIALLALVAVAAVAAPAASAAPPLTASFPLELELYDADTSIACGADVFADLSGVVETRVHYAKDGSIARQVETFHGRITWFTRSGERSYSSAIANRAVIDFPEGVGWFNPVRVTVTGTHGGVFPIGGGPAGAGTLVYDGFMYSEWDGIVYWATDWEPLSVSGDFTRAAGRICAALAA
jgi:hypothetical protein